MTNVNSEAIEVVSAINPDLGEQLKNEMLASINAQPVSSEESGLSYHRAAVFAICQPYSERTSLLAEIAEKKKHHKSLGEAFLNGDVEKEFVEWVSQIENLTDDKGNPVMIEGKEFGFEAKLPATVVVPLSAVFGLYCLCELSNANYLGQKGLTGKSGKVSKGKPSMFDNDSRGVKSPTINAVSANGAFGARVVQTYFLNSGRVGRRMRKALELFVELTNAISNRRPDEAKAIWDTLRGEGTGNARFNFSEKFLKAVIKARFRGLIVSGLSAIEKQIKNLALDEGVSKWKEAEAIKVADLDYFRAVQIAESAIKQLAEKPAEA